MDELERDEPIPVRRICDSSEAIRDALEALPEYGEAVVIEHDGKPLGALIPMKDLDLYQRLFFDREMQLDLAAVAEWEADGKPSISWEQVKAKLGL